MVVPWQATVPAVGVGGGDRVAGCRDDRPTARPRLLLLDGHSLAYRAFFALPVENFSTTTGQHTNAVYGFTSMLINVLRDEQPTHIAVAFDMSRQTFRLERVRRVQGQAQQDARRVQRPAAADQGGARRAADPATSRRTASRPTTSSPRWPPRRWPSGIDVLILHRRPRLLPAGHRRTRRCSTRCAGVSELARMTPAAVEEKYGVPPGALPRARGAGGRDLRQPARRARASGQGYAAKWINQYDGLDNVITHADEITGKKGEALREHLGDVIRNRQLNALVRDLDLPLAPADLALQPWDRAGGAHALRRPGVPGAARPAASRRSTSEEDRSTSPASTSTVRVLGAGEVGRLAGRARRPATRVGVARRRAPGAPAPARSPALALATADGAGRLGRRGRGSTPDDDAALAAWLADPDAAQGAARRQGPDARARGARAGRCAGSAATPRSSAYLARPDQRSYDLADLTAALPQARAASRAATDDGQLSLRRPRRRPAAARDRDAARPRGARPRRRRSTTSSRSAAAPACSPRSSCRWSTCSRGWSRPASPSTSTTSRRSRRSFAGRGASRPPTTAYAVIGKEINLGSPKQLQVVLFDELGMPKTKRTKTGYTTDADALQALYDKTEHPFLQHLLRHRDVDPAAADHRGPAQDGRRRRPHPHDVQPD